MEPVLDEYVKAYQRHLSQQEALTDDLRILLAALERDEEAAKSSTESTEERMRLSFWFAFQVIRDVFGLGPGPALVEPSDFVEELKALESTILIRVTECQIMYVRGSPQWRDYEKLQRTQESTALLWDMMRRFLANNPGTFGRSFFRFLERINYPRERMMGVATALQKKQMTGFLTRGAV